MARPGLAGGHARFPRRRTGDRFRPAEHGHVAALGDGDDDRVVAAGDEIVALHGAPQAPGLDTHHRVVGRVEILVAAKHLGGDGIALEAPGLAGQGLLHHETEKVPHPVRGLELPVAQDALELSADLPVVPTAVFGRFTHADDDFPWPDAVPTAARHGAALGVL